MDPLIAPTPHKNPSVVICVVFVAYLHFRCVFVGRGDFLGGTFLGEDHESLCVCPRGVCEAGVS